jgi:hypothetical protein
MIEFTIEETEDRMELADRLADIATKLREGYTSGEGWDTNGEEDSCIRVCEACGSEIPAVPEEDINTCPYGIFDQICFHCAKLCKDCHEGEHLCENR